MHYRLAEDLPAWVTAVLAVAARGRGGDALPGQADRQRLQGMPKRPGLPQT